MKRMGFPAYTGSREPYEWFTINRFSIPHAFHCAMRLTATLE